MHALGDFLDGTVKILLDNGLQGVIIGLLILSVRTLYKRNCALQDARVIDAQTQTTALNANTAALQRFSDALLQSANRHT
jgi:hypothetical protein